MKNSNSRSGWLAAVTATAIAISPLHGLIMIFEEGSNPSNPNSDLDIGTDIFLEVTDLGAGMAAFEISRGNTFEGFLRNIYFEDVTLPGPQIIGVSFDPVQSSADVMFDDPSNPSDPPGIQGFSTSYSFDADPGNNPGHGVDPGDSAYFKVTYSNSFADLVDGLADGDIRVALHAQGLATTQNPNADESDSYINLPPGVGPIPEPSVLVLLALGFLLPMRRNRPLSSPTGFA